LPPDIAKALPRMCDLHAYPAALMWIALLIIATPTWSAGQTRHHG
jgi:hypothetical protein